MKKWLVLFLVLLALTPAAAVGESAWYRYGGTYTARHGGEAEPWEVYGGMYGDHGSFMFVTCAEDEVASVEVEGEKMRVGDPWGVRIVSLPWIGSGQYTFEHAVPAPAATWTWEPWSWSGSVTPGTHCVGLYGTWYGQHDQHFYAEMSAITVTLTTAPPPDAGGEGDVWTLYLPIVCNGH